jgi:hypothetical protein
VIHMWYICDTWFILHWKQNNDWDALATCGFLFSLDLPGPGRPQGRGSVSNNHPKIAMV